MAPQLRLSAPRLARNSDGPDLVDLVARCFADYPRCYLDVDGEEPALVAPADRLERCWVVEDLDGVVRAMVAAATRGDGDPPTAELKKLYVHPDNRRRGLARILEAEVAAYAQARGCRRIELWSDTRFDLAHITYERLGYQRSGRERLLHDMSDTAEFHFERPLAG